MDSLIFASPAVFHKTDLSGYEDIKTLNEFRQVLSPKHFLFDRSESIKMPFRFYMDEKYKFPNIDTGNLNFKEICLIIVDKIIKENKKIYIMWSGGIDSTMILVLFLMSVVDKDQLVVVCNSDSILEYYWFWKNLVKDKTNLMSTEKLMQYTRFNKLNGIVISGEPNDGLFGGFISNKLLNYFPIDYLHYPITRSNILKTTEALGLTEQSSNCFYDLMIETKKSSPRSIESIFDFYWWYGYNFMWMHNIEKLKARMHPETDQRLFFAHDLLQGWVIKNLEPIKYKHSYKNDFQLDIIYDYTKDREYFENKIKFESMSKTFQTYTALIKTKDKKIIYRNPNILEYYQADNFISAWLSNNQ
jgi:hypothetical protein